MVVHAVEFPRLDLRRAVPADVQIGTVRIVVLLGKDDGSHDGRFGGMAYPVELVITVRFQIRA